MSKNKAAFFEDATRKILQQIDAMGLDMSSRLRAKNLVLHFRDSFKTPEIKRTTLPNTWEMYDYYAHGGCDPLTNLYVHKMGPDWQVMYISSAAWKFGPHVFAKHIPTNKILDITFDQYSINEIKIPYELGHPRNINVSENSPAFRFANAINVDIMSSSISKR